jgi:hypothetical protein
MLYILPYYSDIYKELPNGSRKLIAKNVLRHSQIDLDLIDDITEHVTDTGRIDLKRSLVTHRELGTIVTAIPVEEMWKIREQKNGFEIKGFNIGRYENKQRKSRVSKRPITRKGKK